MLLAYRWALKLQESVRLAVLLLSILLQAACAAGRKPNVIIILADDHGSDGLDATGNPVVHTPHTDDLASQGVSLGLYVGALSGRRRGSG